jgi:predicted nucleotidyltransferase component of viral defense system
MTPARPANVAASVRARLLNVAKAQGVDFNQVLVRFALERILYRLAQSQHAERFLLKGALLFTLWYDMPHRATRDADLLGFGASDLDAVDQTFREIAAVAVDDGMATKIDIQFYSDARDALLKAMAE